MPFIAIQCPSCASTDVMLRGGGNYQCNHCSTAFLRKNQPAPRPAPPPPRAPSVPVNSYGPPPPQATVAPVQHVKPARFRWGLWLFIMLVSFGGPLVAAVAAFVQGSDATQAAAAVLGPKPTQPPPKTPTAVVPRRPAVHMGSAGDADAEPDADAKAGDDPQTQAKPAGEGTSLDQFQRLQGCSCRAKAGKVDLYTRHDGGGTTITSSGTTRSMRLSFALKVGNGTPFTLPLTQATAPSSEYEQGRFPLGVGCDADTVVIASERKLTGWSISDRTERWTVDLPGSLGGVRASDQPSIDCKSISVRGGVATVRVGGDTVKASLDTGEPPRGGASKRSSRRPGPEPEPDDAKADDAKADDAKADDAKPVPPKPAPRKADKADTKAGKKKKKKKKGKKRKKKGKRAKKKGKRAKKRK